MSRTLLLFTALLLSPWSLAQASAIYFEAENLSANRWQYSYTVENQLSVDIAEFTIYFDLGLFENLTITGAPGSSWDGLAVQPDALLPDDGYADWLADTGTAISIGDALGGFSVAFDYLGSGAPGSQAYELYDANFGLLGSGRTEPLPATPPTTVPEPGTPLLIGLGLIGLIRFTADRRSIRLPLRAA